MFEEGALLGSGHERSRPSHQMRRRIGDEPFGRELRRQDVAAAAAADQDLPAAVARAFDDADASAMPRRENGRHQAGGAGPDDDDHMEPSACSMVSTSMGPRLSARMPGSITLRSPTITTANLSG